MIPTETLLELATPLRRAEISRAALFLLGEE